MRKKNHWMKKNTGWLSLSSLKGYAPKGDEKAGKKNFLSVGNKNPSSERHNVRISFGHCIQIYWQWNIHGGSMNSSWIQASCYMLCSIMTWVHSNMSPCRCEVAIPALHIWLVSELGEWEKRSAAVFMKDVLWHWVKRKVSTPISSTICSR